MWIKQLLMGAVGLSGGLLASAGVFTVLLAVGLVPRFAGKTHTNRKVFLYEEMVVIGTLFGGFLSLYEDSAHIGKWVLDNFNGELIGQIWFCLSRIFVIGFGFFAGIFVGCLALAIAEMLDSIPILMRRISFRHGLGYTVLGLALGKMAGSLIYFFWQFWNMME